MVYASILHPSLQTGWFVCWFIYPLKITGGKQMKSNEVCGTSVGVRRMQYRCDGYQRNRTGYCRTVCLIGYPFNALVEMGDLIAKGERGLVPKSQCRPAHYQTFISDLLKKKNPDGAKPYWRNILNFSISSYWKFQPEALSKNILAEGELLSTKLFCTYLEEKGIEHQLLPALEFMSIDQNDEPQIHKNQSKADAI